MVTKILDINTGGLQPFQSGTYRLCIELCPSALTLILWDIANKKPVSIEVFTGHQPNYNDWQSMLQQSFLLGMRDLDTLLVTAYERATPLPLPVFQPGLAAAQLEMLYGKAPEYQYTGGDLVNSLDMIMAWEMPADWHEWLTGHFKILQCCHLMGLMTGKSPSKGKTCGTITVFGNIIWTSIYQNEQLLLVRPIVWQEPDDLSYHLLNGCRQLDIDAADIEWQVSGMVESNSPLLEGITKYFGQVSLMPAGCPVPGELPGHYFSHLYKILS